MIRKWRGWTESVAVFVSGFSESGSIKIETLFYAKQSNEKRFAGTNLLCALCFGFNDHYVLWSSSESGSKRCSINKIVNSIELGHLQTSTKFQDIMKEKENNKNLEWEIKKTLNMFISLIFWNLLFDVSVLVLRDTLQRQRDWSAPMWSEAHCYYRRFLNWDKVHGVAFAADKLIKYLKTKITLINFSDITVTGISLKQSQVDRISLHKLMNRTVSICEDFILLRSLGFFPIVMYLFSVIEFNF